MKLAHLLLVTTSILVISFQDTNQGNYIAIGKLQITFISNYTLLFDLKRQEGEGRDHKLIRRKDSWFNKCKPKINKHHNWFNNFKDGIFCAKSAQCKSGFCNRAECKGNGSQIVRYFSSSPHKVDC